MTRISQIAMILLFAITSVAAIRLKATVAASVASQNESSPPTAVSSDWCSPTFPLQPQQNFVLLLSSTYHCTEGTLRRRTFQRSDSQQPFYLSCLEECGRTPQCNFASIWKSHGNENCFLTRGCNTKDQTNVQPALFNPMPIYLHYDVYGKKYRAAGALGEVAYVWSQFNPPIPGLAQVSPPRWVKGTIREVHDLGCAKVEVLQPRATVVLGPKPAIDTTYGVSHLQPIPIDLSPWSLGSAPCDLGPWKVLQGTNAYRLDDDVEAFWYSDEPHEHAWQDATVAELGPPGGRVGIRWKDEPEGEIEWKEPAHVRRKGTLPRFVEPRSIQNCKDWCTEDANCIGFRAVSDSTTGGLISCEAIEKNGCFDPESVQWFPWKDQTANLTDVQLRHDRVVVTTDIPRDARWAWRLELSVNMVAGDPIQGAKWEFHWKSDPMNLVTNDVANSGRDPPCSIPFEDHTHGSIYTTHYKCNLRAPVAFAGGDDGALVYNPLGPIILNRDGTFDANMMYIEALRDKWDQLVKHEHLANEILNLFVNKLKKKILPIEDWFEEHVVMQFLEFVAHAAAHGSAPVIGGLADFGVGLLGLKIALSKVLLPIKIVYKVAAAFIEHERQMDETDDKIQWVGCNSKSASQFLMGYRRATLDNRLERLCGHSIQPVVTSIINAQVEIFRRFERISECVLSWGWEPPADVRMSDIWEAGRARSFTVDCLSKVLLPGLMGKHGRPGLLYTALSLTISWWQQTWRLFQGVPNNVPSSLSDLFELGAALDTNDDEVVWELAPEAQRGACLGLHASQEAFNEVFTHLLFAATYWVQTFGLVPTTNGTWMAQSWHEAFGTAVKCRDPHGRPFFRPYPLTATQPSEVQDFCLNPRHLQNGDVTRFCDGNRLKFRTDIRRAVYGGGSD